MSKKLRDNFDIRIKQPIDNRFTKENGDVDRPYQGLFKFQPSDKKYYKYIDGQYIPFLKDVEDGIATISLNKLDKSNLFYNVKDYGVKGDGITNDTESLQTLFNSLSSGGNVYFPKGNYKITSVTIPSNVIIFGDGQTTKIKPFGVTSNLFKLSGYFIEVYNMSFENISNYATHAIETTKDNENLPIKIHDLYIASFSNGIYWTKSTRALIDNNTFVNNNIAININEDGRNSVITRNFILGGNGIRLSRAIIQAEGVVISHNQILCGNTGSSTYSILIDGGLAIYIGYNIIDQTFKGVGIQINNNITKNIHIDHNWIGANADTTEALHGILAFKCENLKITENTILGWSQNGIYLIGLSGNTMDKVVISNCDFSYGDGNLTDINMAYVTNIKISNCFFNASSNDIVEDNNCSGLIEGCIFNMIPNKVNLRYGNQLSGLVLRASGTATFTSGVNNVTVTHGLSYTPSIGKIRLLFASFPSNDVGGLSIDTLGATTFRITCQTAPTGTFQVVWVADLRD